MPQSFPKLMIQPHGIALRPPVWGLILCFVSGLLISAVGFGLVMRASAVVSSTESPRLRQEKDSLKSQIAILERSEQVAKAAVTDLQQTLRERDEEIAALRADLAFYGRLVGGSQREGLVVHDLRLTPLSNAPQGWNFIATLTQNLKKNQILSGKLKLSVEGIQSGQLETLSWDKLTQDQASAGIAYSFKYFQQLKGTVILPEGFMPNRINVEIVGDNGRVEQDFSWDQAIAKHEGATHVQ